MGIISWIIFGLIAGILAKWIMPGKDGGGFFMTIILGIVGAVVGAGSVLCLALGKWTVLTSAVSWWRLLALSSCCLSTEKSKVNPQKLTDKRRPEGGLCHF